MLQSDGVIVLSRDCNRNGTPPKAPSAGIACRDQPPCSICSAAKAAPSKAPFVAPLDRSTRSPAPSAALLSCVDVLQGKPTGQTHQQSGVALALAGWRFCDPGRYESPRSESCLANPRSRADSLPCLWELFRTHSSVLSRSCP